MAKGLYTEGSNTYVIVEKKDTLWDIAKEFMDGTSYAAIYKNMKTLASINSDKIPNPNLIYVGQKVYITKSSSDSGSSDSSAALSTVRINQFGLLASEDTDTLFATWSWDESGTKSFAVSWSYISDNSSTEIYDVTKEISYNENYPQSCKQDKYTIPDGARIIYFRIKPIPEKEGAFNAGTTTEKYVDTTPLDTPTAPDVQLKDDKTIFIEMANVNISSADSVIFQIVKNNKVVVVTTDPCAIETNYVSFEYQVNSNSAYKVRAKAYHTKEKLESEWSDYSTNVKTKPPAPEKITTIKATSETSVYLEWSAVSIADTYEVQVMAEDDSKFDINDPTDEKTGLTNPQWEFTNLTSGTSYFFRVRAVVSNSVANASGESDWSPIAGVIIGDKPDKPTTWSSTNTAVVGEDLILYWVHNPRDGSEMTWSQIQYKVNDGEIVQPANFYNDTTDDEVEDTGSYPIDTDDFEEGATLDWRARTMGIMTDDSYWGDWSNWRQVKIYAKPTLDISAQDIAGNEVDDALNTPLTCFPLSITALTGPKTQVPIGCYISIIANQSYDTVDTLGNPKTVSAGERVYSKHFDTFTDMSMSVEIGPGDVDLENSINYTLECRASMDSGLTVDNTRTFTVSWTEVSYEPNAQITLDEETMTTTIRPYCTDVMIALYKVLLTDGVYTKTGEVLSKTYGMAVSGAYTTTGEQVYREIAPSYLPEDFELTDDDLEYYCECREYARHDDVLLSVYRREYDGKYTQLSSMLPSENNTSIVDPHPALDYARYRVVATSASTGAVSYHDLPGYPVGCKAIVIQWNEEWTNFDTVDGAIPVEPAWSGSLLKLYYDVDVNENPSPDVTFVEYVGREHPVSYYGTQVGESASWTTNVPKSDKETIYALRRLARWMDNVYVREPSGVGYWANISVAFSQKHGDGVVPVTFTIKRVEGGA